MVKVPGFSFQGVQMTDSDVEGCFLRQSPGFGFELNGFGKIGGRFRCMSLICFMKVLIVGLFFYNFLRVE